MKKQDTAVIYCENDSRYTFPKSQKDPLHVVNAWDHSEAFKISNKKNVIIEFAHVMGGDEDCVDMVRGMNVGLYDLTLDPQDRSRTHVTIKGGADGILLRRCKFLRGQKWPWHISLGDHTIYGYHAGKVKDVVIDRCTAPFGEKLTVLVLHAEKPTVLNSNVRLLVVPGFIVRLLFWFKKITGKTTHPIKKGGLK